MKLLKKKNIAIYSLLSIIIMIIIISVSIIINIFSKYIVDDTNFNHASRSPFSYPTQKVIIKGILQFFEYVPPSSELHSGFPEDTIVYDYRLLYWSKKDLDFEKLTESSNFRLSILHKESGKNNYGFIDNVNIFVYNDVDNNKNSGNILWDSTTADMNFEDDEIPQYYGPALKNSPNQNHFIIQKLNVLTGNIAYSLDWLTTLFPFFNNPFPFGECVDPNTNFDGSIQYIIL